MVTVPEANRILWDALNGIYAAQREAVARAQQELEKLVAANPDLAHDPVARDAIRAAVARQEGMRRYAESQVGLAQTMRAYWEQRREPEREPTPLPLMRRPIPGSKNEPGPRKAAGAKAAD